MHSLLPKGLNLVNGRYFYNVGNYGAAYKNQNKIHHRQKRRCRTTEQDRRAERSIAASTQCEEQEYREAKKRGYNSEIW
jgi:hypothetical protein